MVSRGSRSKEAGATLAMDGGEVMDIACAAEVQHRPSLPRTKHCKPLIARRLIKIFYNRLSTIRYGLSTKCLKL